MFSLSKPSVYHVHAQISSVFKTIFRSYHRNEPRRPIPEELVKQYDRKTTKRSQDHVNRLRLSKQLSWLLRHNGRQEGLMIRSDGFARVRDVLKLHSMRDVSFKDIQDVIKLDNKARFSLNFEAHGSESDSWWIRANQGHSIETLDLELERVGSADKIPTVIHGTTEEAWKIISKHGLSRMNRNHIHFAQGFGRKDDQKVFSGIRKSSRILIYVDAAKALADGIKFYLSSNDVVLSPGNEAGYLEPKYFQRVERVGRKLESLPWKPVMNGISESIGMAPEAK
ncbi:KptA family-domain-containing protein [Rhodocollybia butyracea]|uniref:2'-phosphotransferase n=1 Tax=Rhodocollybia butyracea TaxID=206335 RepID=A0A9P5UG63_9AGAR|nr:KptA family-domain-containing protein [Rhodocollybia butyracea]